MARHGRAFLHRPIVRSISQPRVASPWYSVDPNAGTITNTTFGCTAQASDDLDTEVDHYMGVYATGNTPTTANIIAGSGTGFVSAKSVIQVANGATAFFANTTGLSPATQYDAWFTVQEHNDAVKNAHAPFQVAFKTAPTLQVAIGHLTISGKTIALNPVAVPTKVSFPITEAWDNAHYASKSGIGWGVFAFNSGTQVIGAKLASGSSETTDVNGLIEATTTLIGYGIGQSVIVLYWKLGGGPLGEDIAGASFETLVSGP